MAASRLEKEVEFSAAFDALVGLLRPLESRLAVKADEPGNYMTETRAPSYRGKPMMFASVASKSYVAFHFFPVYLWPEMLDAISPELRRKMQGKTCWNFRRVEPELFSELQRLVQDGLQRYETAGYL
ncbi:MAG: hypothetical protein H7039_10645 [Bryobacteraceae bacterium]|nr:hypothetical protein [Bryobacteraceae bacterium]